MKAKCICREWAVYTARQVHAVTYSGFRQHKDTFQDLASSNHSETRPLRKSPNGHCAVLSGFQMSNGTSKTSQPTILSTLCRWALAQLHCTFQNLLSENLRFSSSKCFSVTSLFLIKALMFTGIIHTKKCSLHTSISKLFLKTSILLIYGPKFRLFYTIIVVIIMTLFSLSSYFLDSQLGRIKT